MKQKNAVRCLSAFLAAVVCSASLLTAPGAITVSATGSAEVKRYEDRIAQLEREQKELINKINSLDSEAAATLENKQYLDGLISTMMLKIKTSEELVSELDAEIGETEREIAESEKNIELSGERLKERVRQQHEDGKVSYLDVLLGATGVGDFISRLERINTMLEHDKTALDDYTTEKARLEEEKASLSRSKELQKSTLDALVSDKAEFERRSNEAAAYFDALNADKAAAKDEYDKAEKERAALDREIEELMKAAAASPSPSAPQIPAGDFMWPLPTGQGYISCGYGDTDPWERTHYATDIALAAGTPIYAAADASVVRATWHNSYGNYVLLDHGGGNSTLYAHCSALAVSGGQSVKKGQVIGYVGTTGDSQGNHLHFEFRVNGKKVNALNYVPKGC